jgi:hypothetical protein
MLKIKALSGLVLFAFILFIPAGVLNAAGAGSTGLNFLKISQGARPSGMGEAFTGIADDVNAVFWNPAGLTQLSRQQLCLMHSVWLLDVNFEYLAYAIPFGSFGTMAMYGTYLNAGTISKTTEDANGQYVATGDKVSASNFNVTIAYAKKLADIFGEDSAFADMSAGLNINITSEEIATDTGGGYGLSLSTFYAPKYQNISFGLDVENLGFADNRPSLPIAIRMGFGYRFALENIMLPFTEEGYFDFPDNNAAMDLDAVVYPTEQIVRINVGLEKYWVLNKYHSVAARVGYKFGADLGTVAGMTAGLGYRLTAAETNNVDIDYAITPYGDLGISHRISLTGKFFGPPENRIIVNRAEAASYYKLGYDHLYEKRFSEAIEEFSECLKRDKSYASAYIGLGSCFLSMGKRSVALKAYEKALEYMPGNEKLRSFVQSTKMELQKQEMQGQDPWQQ